MRGWISSLVTTALLLFAGGAAADGPTTIELDGPDRATQLLREDVTGDGVMDIVLASGRTVYVWTGTKGGLPTAKPSAMKTLPDDVSFVDAGAKGELVALGPRTVVHVPVVSDDPVRTTAVAALAIDWSAKANLVFADLYRNGRLLVPIEGPKTGWGRFDADGNAETVLEIAPAHGVEQAGPFLEDTATVSTTWPYVELAKGADGTGQSLWALDGPRVVAQGERGRVEYDVAFLPKDGERWLVDLDGDGLPDLVHIKTTNHGGQYGFFHTSPAKPGSATGPPHAPARSFIRLSGFQLEPEFVDVDGDGLLDFVVTTMEIDAKNTLRAMTSGLVTAETRVFINRSDSATGRYFDDEPDARVTSDVGIAMRFTYAGTIEVTRSLTIVVDGDYDGDGRLDLAIRTGADRIRIQHGVEEGGWAASGRDIAIPAIGPHTRIEAYAVDTNGDEQDELLLVYRAEQGRRERLVLVDP